MYRHVPGFRKRASVCGLTMLHPCYLASPQHPRANSDCIAVKQRADKLDAAVYACPSLPASFSSRLATALLRPAAAAAASTRAASGS